MVQQPKSYTAYQSDILGRLVNSGIQQLAPGGKARAICDALADQVSQKEANQFMDLAGTLLPFALGRDLDLIGEINGVPRIPPTTAAIDSSDQTFLFYVKTGSFGSINNGQDITIPAGVQIFTSDSNGPVYVTQALTLPATAGQVYFSAVSMSSGASSNAPAGVFSKHNFTGYADYRFGSLLVANNSGITGGRDQEDDDSYRSRIRLKLLSTSNANEDFIRSQILPIPGIQDVVLDRRAGVFYVYVYAITPLASASLLETVQQAINDNVAYPATGTALNPELVGISLASTISLKSGSSSVDQQIAEAAATTAVQNYINDLGIGNSLVINEIADQILNANPLVVGVGQPNQPLNEIYIWRSRSDGSRYSRSLIADFTPALGERVVVEDQPRAVSITAV